MSEPTPQAGTPRLAVPQWVVGRTVTAFTLTPASGTAQTLAGCWDEVDVDCETETEEISAADSILQNTVILKDIWRIRCVQILKMGTTNPLAEIWNTTDLLTMNLVHGGNTWTLQVARTGYTENIRKGKSVGIFTGAIVDPGAGA
jgi:hypothetical protein